VNLCHFFDFCHPKNPYEKYTPPYGTARGDPILMEGTVNKTTFCLPLLEFNQLVFAKLIADEISYRVYFFLNTPMNELMH
jgi:hypothetical protein